MSRRSTNWATIKMDWFNQFSFDLQKHYIIKAPTPISLKVWGRHSLSINDRWAKKCKKVGMERGRTPTFSLNGLALRRHRWVTPDHTLQPNAHLVTKKLQIIGGHRRGYDFTTCGCLQGSRQPHYQSLYSTTTKISHTSAWPLSSLWLLAPYGKSATAYSHESGMLLTQRPNPTASDLYIIEILRPAKTTQN